MTVFLYIIRWLLIIGGSVFIWWFNQPGSPVHRKHSTHTFN